MYQYLYNTIPNIWYIDDKNAKKFNINNSILYNKTFTTIQQTLDIKEPDYKAIYLYDSYYIFFRCGMIQVSAFSKKKFIVFIQYNKSYNIDWLKTLIQYNDN